MVQGLGLSMLVRAHSMTKDAKYLEIGEEVLNSFLVTIVRGGVLYVAPADESVWYLEWPAFSRPKTLNGFIFALLGIWDYYQVTKKSTAKVLFAQGIQSLKDHLHEFDKYNRSSYDLGGDPFSYNQPYHQLHIKQLATLYDITGEEIFNEYSKKWKKE